MDWARHHDRVTLPEDHAYADQIFAVFQKTSPSKDDVRYAAALRCAVLWRLYNQHKKNSAVGLPYMIGVILDSHVPLISSFETVSRCIEPYELYSTSQFVQLSPDNPMLEIETSDELSVPSHKCLEWLWKMSSDLPKHNSAETTDLLKLLLKGAPRPVSIRYILSTIKKQLIPKPNKLILRLLKTFVVGGWQHATTIASPIIRLKLVVKTGIDYILQKISPPFLCSKELYTVIAEGLYSYTRHHSAMYRVLRQDSAWKKYRETILYADSVVRASIYSDKPPVRSRSMSIQLNHDIPATNSNKWNAFVFAFGCSKAKIPHKITSALPNVTEIYKVLEDCPYTCRFHIPTLKKMGMTQIETIASEVENLQRDKLQRTVNRIVANLSKESRAILYTYMHYIIYRNQLQIRPLLCPVKHCSRAQNASDSSCLLYCGTCFTIRTQSRGEFDRKSREGLLLDTMTRELFCSSCKSDKIIPVDCKKNMVFGYSVNASTTKLPYSACCCCGEVTLVNKIIGTQSICTKCYAPLEKTLVPQRCLCGKEMLNSKTSLVVRTENKFQLIGLCNQHSADVYRLLGKPPRMPSLDVIKLILAHK